MMRTATSLLAVLMYTLCTHSMASDALEQLERRDPWRAAVQYCERARAGDTEAIYRLGMLYAFGSGVPASRAQAATLFSLAARQGHAEAFAMLETIHFAGDMPPPCVLAVVEPERAPMPVMRAVAINSKIRRAVAEVIARVAEWHEVDPRLVLAIAWVESGLNPHARSPKDAMGVMQLIPATAARFDVKDTYNISQNVRGGVRYLRWLLDRYDGRVELAAAAYNAGEKAVDRYGGVPPYRETRDYVRKVQSLYPHLIHVPDQRARVTTLR
ncbi:lytic transglycosylase domain-containing protein [Chitinibacteraceae bacterium HSL-7]